MFREPAASKLISGLNRQSFACPSFERLSMTSGRLRSSLRQKSESAADGRARVTRSILPVAGRREAVLERGFGDRRAFARELGSAPRRAGVESRPSRPAQTASLAHAKRSVPSAEQANQRLESHRSRGRRGSAREERAPPSDEPFRRSDPLASESRPATEKQAQHLPSGRPSPAPQTSGFSLSFSTRMPAWLLPVVAGQ